MKKNRIIIGIIYAILLLAVIFAVVALNSDKFSTFLILNNDGYIVSENVLTRNLLDKSLKVENADCDAVAFSTSDIIYEKSGDFYLGENKVPVNSIYPLFINNASATMILSDNISLVSEDFEYAPSYTGLYISEGLSFNPDMEKAYRENFILLSLTNGLFVNAIEIKVKGNFIIEEIIPANSIIRFMENEIRYYTLDGEHFSLNTITPLQISSTLTLNKREYGYYDFLEKLGLYEKAILREKEENTSSPEIEPTLMVATPTPQITEGSDNTDGDGNDSNRPDSNNGGAQGQSNQKDNDAIADDTQIISPTSVPTKTPKDDNQNIGSGNGGTTNPGSQDNQNSSNKIPEPPKPANEAEPAKLPDQVLPPTDNLYDDSQDTDSNVEEEPERGNPEWKKPVVKLQGFTTSVYSILSTGMVVENNEFLYRSGISFEVYQGNKLVMRKAYNASGDISIAPLQPDTEYKVVVSMEYYNKYHYRQKEDITEAIVHTKSLSELEPLKFNWRNGDIFYDKIQLKDVTITNALKGTREVTYNDGSKGFIPIYLETVQYINRIEVLIKSKTDEALSYTLPVSGTNLKELRNGNLIQYESGGKILSDTQYYYEFICYDRFGNILPMDGVVRGSTHTCKQPPKAEIKVIKNEVKNVELTISISNKDHAVMAEDSIYFCVYDRNNNPVSTTISRLNSQGAYVVEDESSEIHAVPLTGTTIKFMDLLDQEIYNISVFCDYDINDGKGLYETSEIGKTQFTTVPIAALGYAFFDVALHEVDDHSAKLTISFNTSRTDQRLVSLISGLDVSFLNKSTQDGTGIKMAYGSEKEVEQKILDDDLLDLNGVLSFTSEELERMKTGGAEGESVSYTFYLDQLDSNTTYDIRIMPKVQMGSGDLKVIREVKAYYIPDSITTMKKTPVIEIDAIYASKNFIKLYGVTVNDPDRAVITYPVSVVVYNDQDVQIATYKINSSDANTLIDVTKLDKDRYYTFRFFAAEYNPGLDRKTYRKNYELFYSGLNESKEYLKIMTREAVSGSIQLQEISPYKVLDKRTILAKEMISYNKSVTLAGTDKYRYSSNSQKKAKFSMQVNFGLEHFNSFQIRYSYPNTPSVTTYKLYLKDPDTNPSEPPIGSVTLNGLTRSAEYSRLTDLVFFDGVTMSGQQTIYLVLESSTAIQCLWGVEFQRVNQSETSHYYANLQTLVDDKNKEIGEPPSYLVKVYENGTWIDTRRHEWKKNQDESYTLNMYQVASDQSETLVDVKTFQGQERLCDTNFYYKVKKGHYTYRFELLTVVFNYEIKLDSEEFTTEEEIIGIRTPDDLMNLRYGLDKKYYVLNDIEFPLNWNNITASQAFKGELDFRGYQLKFNSTGNLISTLGYGGTLKNLVYSQVDDWGMDAYRTHGPIISNNYGSVSNLMYVYRNGNREPRAYRTGAFVCSTNYESGIIENFAIKLEDDLISTNYVSAVCTYNRGLIRNGYVYGGAFKRTERAYLSDTNYSANLYVGSIVSVNRLSGTVENVYNLTDIQTRPVLSSNDYAFSLIGLNDGTLKNSFSTADVYYGGSIRENYGPAYRNRYQGSSTKNTYYYSKLNYGNTDNKLINKLLLYDMTWYDRLFNKSQNTKTGQFNLDPVSMGYYPHVKWPAFMPEQEFNRLPELAVEDELEIIDAYITEQGDNYAEAVITFHNPDRINITGFDIDWLGSRITSQEDDNGLYRVRVLLTLSNQPKYFSEYDINSFSYSLGYGGSIRTKQYLPGEEPKVPAEFYMPITSEEEWTQIKDDYSQNYRLYADLEFRYRSPENIVNPANVLLSVSDANFKKDAFSGKLDGNNHKISYVDTGTYGYVFGKLTGTIKNLTIEFLDAKRGDGRFKGVIGRMLEGSYVDNVHVLGMEATSYEHCGGIAGDIYGGIIVNSSVHDLKITTLADGNYVQYVGGLAGKHRVSSITTIHANASIQNSYVDGIEISALASGDCGGIGGLIGYIRPSAEITSVYVVNGSIKTIYKNAGGLIGAVDTFTNSEAGFYKLKDYYVDVDITTNTDNAGGIIGFTKVDNSEKEEEHGLVLGNITNNQYEMKSEQDQVGRHYDVGRYYGSTTQSYGAIYGYEFSYFNGGLNAKDDNEILTDASLLTYEKLCNPSTYSIDGELNWEVDFIRDNQSLANGILPKLNSTYGQELPYQKPYVLENHPITIQKITTSNYKSGNLYTVQIELKHPSSLMIDNAIFQHLKVADLGGSGEEFIIKRGPTTQPMTTTVLEYVLDIEGYYDTYYLTGIQYHVIDSEDMLTQATYLNVGITPQYLEIASADEWNRKMAPDVHGLKGYNVRIVGDLDFTSVSGNAKMDVIVNHLVGINKTDYVRIKGIQMQGYQSLVSSVYGDVGYLRFEDITLTKTKELSPDAINSFGIFSAITGNLHHVEFNNITINAYQSAYVGIVALGYGMNYSIDMNNVTVNGIYLSEPTKRAVGGLVARLSGTGGVYQTTAKNLMVEGRAYTGGIVGIQEEGKYLWDIEVDSACVSSLNASYSYVGGIAGYANITSLADKVGYLRISNSVVAGTTYVGGVIGVGSITGDPALNALQNDSFISSAHNVGVYGTGSYIGGLAGQGIVRRAETRNSEVYGLFYIGGITGNGSSYYTSVTDSTISTVYDRKEGDTKNLVFQTAIANKIAYYNNLKSNTSDEKLINVYNQAIKTLGYLVTTSRNNSYSTLPTSGNNNTKIGGISGRSISISNAIVTNCNIGAYGAISVGGIVSRTESSSYGTGPYRIAACGTINSNIYGAEDVGGIIGTHWRGTVFSCYSNSNVTATRTNAGGIAGFVNGTNLYSVNETPYAYQVYYSGTVKAPTNVAGIFGYMQQYLFSNNSGWLMGGNVEVTNPQGVGNFFINRQSNDEGKIIKSLFYKDSMIKFGSNSYTAEKYYYEMNPLLLIKDEIDLITSAELKTKDTYTLKLDWSDNVYSSSNYSSLYWNYNGLANNYMPYLTYAPTNNYFMDSSRRIMPYQEDYLMDAAKEKVLVDSRGLYMYQYETYQGGVPIPGSGAVVYRLLRTSFKTNNLPQAEFYAVDADKLNIEFAETNSNMTFEVRANGIVVAKSNITQRAYTLAYDFKSELELIVSDGENTRYYEIWPEDVSRNIMTWASNYYYITIDGIKGNKETISGHFVHLYAGHAIDIYGKVWDVESAQPIRTLSSITLEEKVSPLHRFVYESYAIDTYKNYSIVDSTTRNKLRLYVKQGELSAISSGMSIVMDSVVLDNYNGNKYCSVLSNEGVIVDMLENRFTYPEDFDNQGIQYMTNNLYSNDHIVLVRYYDGAVAGFNYITGEKLNIDSPRANTNTSSGMSTKDSGRVSSISMVNFASLYVDSMSFESDLNAIGWAEVNGVNTADGSLVSKDYAKINEEATFVLIVEESFVLDDGNVVSSNLSMDRIQNETTPVESTQPLENIGSTVPTESTEALESENGLNAQNSIDSENSINNGNPINNESTQNDVNSNTNKNELDSLNNTTNLIKSEIMTLIHETIAMLKTNGVTLIDIEKLEAAIQNLIGVEVSREEIQMLKNEIQKLIELSSSDEMKTALNEVLHQVAAIKTSEILTRNDSDLEENKVINTTNESSTVSSNKTEKEDIQSGVKTSTKKSTLIPVYDEEASKFVLYDEEELLTKEDEELDTMNEKVERAGHMIDYRSKHVADKNQPGDDNVYGYILIAASFSVIALLLSNLILKKRKEAIQ